MNTIARKYNTLILGLLFTVFILRMLFPSLRYVSIVFFLLGIPFLLIYIKRDVFSGQQIKIFIRTLYLYLSVNIVFVFAFVIGYQSYGIIYKELFNLFILGILFYFVLILTNKGFIYSEFLKIFQISIVIISTLASLVGIFLLVSRFIGWQRIELLFPYSIGIGSSIVSDNNFYALGLLLGFVVVLVNNKVLVNFKTSTFVYNIILLVLSLAILFSSSRRGVLILFLIYGAYAVKGIVTKNGLKLLQSTLLPIIIFITIFGFLIFGLSPKIKTEIIDAIGANSTSTKLQIANLVFDYQTIYKKSLRYQQVYNKIWGNEKEMNKHNPSSGWATRNHKQIYPLKFGNYEGISPLSIGYQLSSITDASDWRGHAHAYSKIAQFFTADSNAYSVEVYCFVSNGFNGDKVSLQCSGNSISGKLVDYYDLNKKGTWQKLQIYFSGSSNVGVFLSFIKGNSVDFKNLKGNVIFAQPSVIKNNIFHENQCIINWANCRPEQYRLFRAFREKIDLWYCNKEINKIATEKSELNKLISYRNLYSYYTGNLQLLDSIDHFYASLDDSLFWKNKVINHPTIKLINKKKSQKEFIGQNRITVQNDSMLVNNIIFEGKRPGLENRVIGNRKSAWIFALKIFSEYRLINKILGNGFGYLEKYGYKYYGDSKRLDYPHNPIVSTFLYSGILGGLIYILFLVASFWNYWKYRKHHQVFLIMYLITFFFMMFSGNSHFSVPIFTFLSIIPFLTKYYVNKESAKSKINE
jgi:hypothetical protein